MNNHFLRSLRRSNERRNAVWDPEGKLSPQFFMLELIGELGEAANVLKKLEREKLGLPGSRATIIDLEHELADAVICTDLLAMALDIEISTRMPDVGFYPKEGGARQEIIACTSHVGLIGHNVDWRPFPAYYSWDFGYIMRRLEFAAQNALLEIETATIEKFNLTSAKLNLPTFEWTPQ